MKKGLYGSFLYPKPKADSSRKSALEFNILGLSAINILSNPKTWFKAGLWIYGFVPAPLDFYCPGRPKSTHDAPSL